MKIFVCVFQSLADFQACFPNSKPFTESAFQDNLKRIDSQIAQLVKQGQDAEKVFATASEYLAWLDAASDFVKALPEKEQMAAFAEFKGNQ